MKPVMEKKPGRPCDLALLERRREEILSAATVLFAEEGYSAADMQVLADRIQVGKGTIYRYFPSKRDLFLAAADRVMRKMSQQVDAAIAGIDEPLERVERGMNAYLSFFALHPEYVELLIQERAQFKDRKKPTYFTHQEVRQERWRALYQSLIGEGRLRKMPVERIIDVISDLLYGTMFTNYFAGQRKPFEAQTRDLLDIVFNGILSEGERCRRGVVEKPVA
jgi:AcrR family transcriptional regulator